MHPRRTTPRLAAMTTALLVWFSPDLGAQEPLVTDRPDFTESATSVVPGRVQLEGGWMFEDAGAVESHTLGEILFRIGILPRTELRVGLNSFVTVDGPAGDPSGLEDVSIGTKIELVDGLGARPGTAILLGTTVPTGDGDVADEEWQPEAILALAWDLSGRVGLGANVGWTYAGTDDDRFHEGKGSLALGIALDDRVGVFAEGFGFVSEEDDPAFADAGVTLLFGDDFQLDGRVGAGLNDEASDWFVGLGATRRW